MKRTVHDEWADLIRAPMTEALRRPFLAVPPDGDRPPTLVRVGELLHLAIAWAGLDHEPQVVDARRVGVSADPSDEPELRLTEVSERRLTFEIRVIGRESRVFAAMGRELGRAYVALGRLSAGYRDSPLAPLRDWSAEDERRAEVASVYLGFGLVVVAVGLDGALSRGERIGLLAERLAARGLVETEIAGALEALDGETRQDLQTALRALEPGSPPPALTLDPAPPPDRLVAEWTEAEARHRRPNLGLRVPKRVEWKRKPVVWMGLSLAAIASIPLFTHGLWWVALAVVAVGGLISPAMIGGAHYRGSCGACGAPMGEHDPECPRCGATPGRPEPPQLPPRAG